MKIHELSKYTHIHPETIRLYRQKGLLRPIQNPANGYYEYSETDLISLLFIRMRRSSNLAVKTISNIFVNDCIEEMLDNYDNEIARIQQQIRSLEQKLDVLKLNRAHLEQCTHEQGVVSKLAAHDNKYDLPLLPHLHGNHLGIWLQHPELCTISLVIEQKFLNGELPDTPIPVIPALGIYQTLLEHNGLPLPEPDSPAAVFYCPKGDYLSVILELDSLHAIWPERLKPLQQYARRHGFHFVSNITSFLIRIDYGGPQATFLFRMRARVEMR